MSAYILALLELEHDSSQVFESLKITGDNVVVSKTFREAILVLEREPIDLVISDVHLENGGSVFDFLKWVRKNDATRRLPFVMFSCRPTALARYVEDGVRTTARLLGATKYISMDVFDGVDFSKQIHSVLIESGKTADSSKQQPLTALITINSSDDVSMAATLRSRSVNDENNK